MKRLAIVTTHPIQYNAPLFKSLTERGVIEIHVFYTWSQAQEDVFDPGFGKHRAWDIPLLDGYAYTFVKNTSANPGSHHFNGIKNPGLVNDLHMWQPDAILIYGWRFRSHLQCLRYFKNKVPIFFRGDSNLLDEVPGIKTVLRRAVLKWVYRHVDTAFYVGTHNKTYFNKHGLNEKQLVAAPHAIDNERFIKISCDQIVELNGWRQSLSLSDQDSVLLFVGKLEKKKNPAFILELAKKLPHPNLRFLIVGSGELEYELQAQAIDRRILFLPFQNQSKMPLVYRLGNWFILPSVGPGETWGLSANEAMACGLPVLLSEKAGGAIDLVRDNGILFGVEEVEKVASYISDQIDTPEKQVIAANASRRLIENFSIDRVAEAIENKLRNY